MNSENERGVVVIDTAIAIMAIMIFSVLIIFLSTNNIVENIKLKKETMAAIYITEIFENIGRANYDDINIDNINSYVPQEVNDNYKVDITMQSDFAEVANYENIMKKVIVNLSYQIRGKTYTCSMERIKIKE